MKIFYNCKANDFGVVWCGVYRHLLTNRLHSKAAELCLAHYNSGNYRVTATKYIEYINSIHFLSSGIDKVLL